MTSSHVRKHGGHTEFRGERWTRSKNTIVVLIVVVVVVVVIVVVVVVVVDARLKDDGRCQAVD